MSSPSKLYTTLKSTAETFANSTSFSAPSNGPDISAIRAICTEDYKQSWGHDYFTSTRPHMNKTLDFDGFLGHLNSMVPRLESAHVQISDMIIDETQKRVVVRATYRLTPKGSKESGSNDLLWILEMHESGEKVKSGKEFIDGDAAMRLKELMQASSANK